MRTGAAIMIAILLSGALLCGCGGGGSSSGGGSLTPVQPQTAAPTVTTAAAQNSAVIVSLASSTSGASIYFTTDGTVPSTSSQQYQAPFLVASNLTVNAIAQTSGDTVSNVTTQSFSPNIASGTLVWSDEFTNSGASNAQPNPATWTYDTGNSGFGNSELETYCAWGSTAAPCNTASPNAYVGTDNYLHIVAQQPTAGTAVYTSARMKTEGLFSFQYGRIEARMQIPESQGMWPAFWLLGSNINYDPWPACGELDVMEHINGSNPENLGYDWTQSSVHGTNLNGGTPYTTTGFSAAAWHTYGMIWSKGQIQYYVDSPTGPGQPYETFKSTTQAGTWPFDQGPQFIIMNLAVGGTWPGSPNATTVFPSQLVVDYVRLYTN
jgi:beta-glucanase (GH16 family)